MANNNNTGVSRREFLKLIGYTTGAAVLATSCEQPVRKAIPYLIQPEDVVPGKSSYYATTFFENGEYCPLVVKVRDGRPIKIEGNDLCRLTNGGTTTRVQASIMGLYDPDRIGEPLYNGKTITWEDFFDKLIAVLNTCTEGNKTVLFILPAYASPSSVSLFDKFQKKYPCATFIAHRNLQYVSIAEAHSQCFNLPVVPSYNIDKANLLVSFGADFLGTWLSPVEFTSLYATRKSDIKPPYFKHIHFESNLSLTGANADKRIAINPKEEFRVLLGLYRSLTAKLNQPSYVTGNEKHDFSWLADELLQNNKSSIVISGNEDIKVQVLVNAINFLLDNYGNTIFTNVPYTAYSGSKKDILQQIKQLQQAGNLGGIIFYDVNPAYENPDDGELKQIIKSVGFSAFIGSHPNETSDLTTYVLPSHHYLESWGDFEPKPGLYSLAQPLIHPLFNSKQFQDILLAVMEEKTTYQNFIKEVWRNQILPIEYQQGFTHEWLKILQKGIYFKDTGCPDEKPAFNHSALRHMEPHIIEPDGNDIIMTLYEPLNIGPLFLSNIPWLHELPDPLSKISWDNYVNVSPEMAERFHLSEGETININNIAELPVHIQKGQYEKTISIARNYGRANSGRISSGIGVNAYLFNETIKTGKKITILKTGKKTSFAKTQIEDSTHGRDLIREYKTSDLNDLRYKEDDHKSMYPPYEHPGHHWAMAIDLNRCTGCNACVIACQVENNIPVVGKDEIVRGHDMHWLKVDRYYEGKTQDPEVLFQPLLCQHCEQAPCENVCPVAATTHSKEGLNQMIYNRCIGTRYCANNCPYKVRRFNWYDYNKADAINGNEMGIESTMERLPRLVLNPDVTLRGKGVIEKCSFCIQRIQEGKRTAKEEGRLLRDLEVKPACMQACPAGAIVFGDVNDPDGKINSLTSDARSYHLLGGLNTKPSITYLAKTRNS